MQGWMLKEGNITDPDIGDPEIWQRFNMVFSTQSKNQASYKFGLVRSLVENLYNLDEDLALRFDQIFEVFARIYWNLVIGHHLRQSDASHSMSAIERILYHIREKYAIPEGLSFDALAPDIQAEIVRDVKVQGKKYVLGALWGDTKGSFYEFSTPREYLRFNPPVYRFLQRYHQVILRLNNYEWAKFLEKNNPGATRYIDGVETITKRNGLSGYLKILEQYTEYQCFYCEKPLGKAKPHVDHFIPWSYIHADNLWNLVLACQSCNLSKSDHLAETGYLQLLQKRNERLQELGAEEVNAEFTAYRFQKLTELYKYAEGNGFDGGWRPEGEVKEDKFIC